LSARQTSEARVVELGDGIFAWLPGDDLDANSGFIITDDGVVVIDSLAAPGLARQVLAEVRRVTDKPVRYVVNTHHHGDHVLGNGVFTSASIIAHYKCRQIMAEAWHHYARRWAFLKPEFAQELAEAEVCLPNVTFSDRFTLHAGSRRLEFMHAGFGHTVDDIVIYLPQDKVLFAADLLFNRVWPHMRDSNSQGWIECIDRLLPLDATSVVPGHGPVGTKQDLVVQREFMSELRGAVLDCFREAMDEEQATKTVRLEKYAGWPGEDRLPIAVQRIYAELRGEFR